MEKGLDGKAALSKYMMKKQKEEQSSDSVKKAVASVAKVSKEEKSSAKPNKLPAGKVDTKSDKSMDPKMFGDVASDEAKAKKKKRPYLDD